MTHPTPVPNIELRWTPDTHREWEWDGETSSDVCPGGQSLLSWAQYNPELLETRIHKHRSRYSHRSGAQAMITVPIVVMGKCIGFLLAWSNDHAQPCSYLIKTALSIVFCSSYCRYNGGGDATRMRLFLHEYAFFTPGCSLLLVCVCLMCYEIHF